MMAINRRRSSFVARNIGLLLILHVLVAHASGQAQTYPTEHVDPGDRPVEGQKQKEEAKPRAQGATADPVDDGLTDYRARLAAVKDQAIKRLESIAKATKSDEVRERALAGLDEVHEINRAHPVIGTLFKVYSLAARPSGEGSSGSYSSADVGAANESIRRDIARRKATDQRAREAKADPAHNVMANYRAQLAGTKDLAIKRFESIAKATKSDEVRERALAGLDEVHEINHAHPATKPGAESALLPEFRQRLREALATGERQRLEYRSRLGSFDEGAMKSERAKGWFALSLFGRKDPLKVGDIGMLEHFCVFQVIDGQNLIVSVAQGFSRDQILLWVTQFPTEGLTNAAGVESWELFEVYDTATYRTVAGTQTIFKVRPLVRGN